MIRLFFTHWTLKRALIQLKQLFKGGEDLLARQHKIDWKIYFGLLFIFVPLILLTVFYLPGSYKSFGFIWVLIFWKVYHVIRIKR